MRNVMLWACLLVVGAVIVAALFAPFIAPYSPTRGELAEALNPPFWAPDGVGNHLLGTDAQGRDVLSRILYGARVSLSISLIAIFISGVAGTLIGLVAGLYGGIVDTVLMRIVDIGLSMPLILMAVLLAVVLGASLLTIIVIIGLLLWPRYARQIRGEVLGIKEQDFVALARTAGCSGWRIMFRHLLPNVVPTLLVLVTLQVGYVILLESSLSFLGVGVPPPQPAWGLMVADGRGQIATAWWVALFPGLAILLSVVALNHLGDYVRDRLDPKLRQVE